MTIVDCTKEYWMFVRKLRNNPAVQKGFIEQTNITELQQIEYMEKHSHEYRIGLVDGTPAGYVGVVDNDIRVCTSPQYQGIGLGVFMLTECKNVWPEAVAKVKHGNTASQKLFTKSGYERISQDKNFTYYKHTKKMPSLKSTVTEKGKYVSQILHFIGGEKRTFNRVDTESIKQGQFTKFETEDGRLVMVNDKNILCIEIIKEDE